MSYLPFELCRIVDGKRFDTESASQIGYNWEGPASDFCFVEEALFQTPRSKRYFLAGQGGAATRYAEHLGHGQGRCAGSGIFPLSAAEAFAWAQAHLDTWEIEEHFEDMIEDA